MTTFSRTSRTIAIATAVVGGLVLLGVGASAAVAAIHATNSSGTRGDQALDVTGITGIDVESNSSQFKVEFGDVPEATLTVEGDSRYIWQMSVSGDELVVTSKSSLFDFCIGWCAPGNERVTLTLPIALSNGELSADLTVDTGTMNANGNFSELDIEVNAGAMTFDGTARTLTTSVNAGRANLTVDSAREVDLDVDAGSLTAILTGSAPRSTTLDVSAGSLDLTLPDAEYRVSSDIEVGKFTNDLRVTPTARNIVDVSLSAGKLSLQSK